MSENAENLLKFIKQFKTKLGSLGEGPWQMLTNGEGG